VIWLENENQSIFNIITHDKVNNKNNRLASCTVPEHVSSFREPSVSVCVEGTVRDQILLSLVVPHFDGHPLASRPIMMDVNARPHDPQTKATFIRPVHSLPRPDIPSHMVTCPLKPGSFMAY
jgi:hypothetical protein